MADPHGLVVDPRGFEFSLGDVAEDGDRFHGQLVGNLLGAVVDAGLIISHRHGLCGIAIYNIRLLLIGIVRKKKLGAEKPARRMMM
jgi:hypothetical protein